MFSAEILEQPSSMMLKCSRHLGPVIKQAGGRPLMWKTGHSLVKAKMKETGALLGGEMSGHIFLKSGGWGLTMGCIQQLDY